MDMTMEKQALWKCYSAILRQELVTALGCTEPVAVAYAAAVARKTLGTMPEKIEARCSGNIIKNVKSVIVPNAGGMRGIDVAAVLGAVAGKPEKKLAALMDVTPEDVKTTKQLLDAGICRVKPLQGVSNLQIVLIAWAGEHTALVEILGGHTQIVRVERDGILLYEQPRQEPGQNEDYASLSFDGILEYARQAPLDPEIRSLMLEQAQANQRIAREGMTGDYGAAIGKTLTEACGSDVKIRAAAYAAAGSDARMNGCELPVVINSGSGNQGITVCVPVVQYARELGADEETLCRALLISNLTAIHLKRLVGRLSAFCGVVSAGCGSGAAITYLKGGTPQQIRDTVVNTLGNVSGIVCDGAKASCAAKIGTCVQAAILGHEMAMKGRCFRSGDGIIKDNIEETIRSVARMGREGMRDTDRVILEIMTEG